MYSLVLSLALPGFLISTPPDVSSGEGTPPLHRGTWRVVGIIEGPASSTDAKTVQITDKRLVILGDEEKEEYAIVGLDLTRQPAVIDLRDVRRGRTYRGIYEREGKRLRLCVQFWTKGDAKTSVRPASFKEADPANVFGPTLFLLEPQ